MIHYHGLPITPDAAAVPVLSAGHAFVSWLRHEQIQIVIEACQSFAVDNGAFSAWRAGRPIADWAGYYEWVWRLMRVPSFDFAVIPDVIDGDEKANDALIDEWPHGKIYGAPVWHMHESLDRLARLCSEWHRVCIGSSGQWATVGDFSWWSRMAEAMNVACDKDGYPRARLHGLRMLNPDVFSSLPLASADSTNVARRVGLDQDWRQSYAPPDKPWRGALMRARIESTNATDRWVRQATQAQLLEIEA